MKAFTEPFDSLPATTSYAQRLANDSGVARVVVRAHPVSEAQALGLFFGVFTREELRPEDEGYIVATLEPEVRTPAVNIMVIVMVDGETVHTVTPADLEGVAVDRSDHLTAAMQATTATAIADAVTDRLAAK